MAEPTAPAPYDHDVPGDVPSTPPPLVEISPARHTTPAEEARTLSEGANTGSLATLTEAGEPWASLVAYGLTGAGEPVLCLSRLAEHGRNIAADPRASIVIAAPAQDADPLTTGRVTLAGRAEVPEGEELDAAREALLAGVPGAGVYVGFGDFTTWVLRVQRVRWVGGYGRMSWAEAGAYAAAEADPVAAHAAGAVAHLNDDHADALLDMATALGGYPDATSAACTGADRYGLDLILDTPRGRAPTRVGFAAPVTEPGGLRAATVELAQRARAG